MKNIGFKLSLVAQAKGYSQEFLAKEVGVTRATISNYFNNKHELKSDCFLRLLKVLDIPVDTSIDKKISSILDKTDLGSVGSLLDELFENVHSKLKKKNLIKLFINLANEYKSESYKVDQIHNNLIQHLRQL